MTRCCHRPTPPPLRHVHREGRHHPHETGPLRRAAGSSAQDGAVVHDPDSPRDLFSAIVWTVAAQGVIALAVAFLELSLRPLVRDSGVPRLVDLVLRTFEITLLLAQGTLLYRAIDTLYQTVAASALAHDTRAVVGGLARRFPPARRAAAGLVATIKSIEVRAKLRRTRQTLRRRRETIQPGGHSQLSQGSPRGPQQGDE